MVENIRRLQFIWEWYFGKLYKLEKPLTASKNNIFKPDNLPKNFPRLSDGLRNAEDDWVKP